MAIERDLFVVVFLRGGCDGLNFVAPIDGPDRKIYEEERPNIKMPLTGSDALIKLNEQFGIHPLSQPLVELFQSGNLAIVHGVGLPTNNRSHFDSQAYMELGTPGNKGTSSGWLTRHLLSVESEKTYSGNPLAAISLGIIAPTSLLSFQQATTISEPGRFGFAPGDSAVQEKFMASMAEMYGGGSTWLHDGAKEALKAVELVGRQKNFDYKPAGGSEYPKADIGNKMKTLAQLLKMDLGVRLATVDMGQWDTHKYQGQGSDGQFAKLVEQLSQALHAFYNDMSSQKLTLVVMTEFGRRLRENANKGTDHGHGGMMLVLGNHVNGKKVYDKWLGLKTENLYERADLAVTTDFRSVLGEILSKRLGNDKIGTVFPSFKGFSPLGIVRA